MATTSISVRMDSEVKRDAQAIFAELGMDMSTAINIFLRQAVQQRGLPFEVKLSSPNAQTLEAMEEIHSLRSDKNKKTYASFSEILKEVSDV